MSFLNRIFGGRDQRAPLEPLYRAVVAAGRDPVWYRDGGVPDTMDGRFDMIAALLALVLLRMEEEGDEPRAATILLTEIFIDDMDGSLRQIGIGDHVVGKHVGKMMSALGGRLAAFREAPGGDAFEAAVRRNIYHEAPPSPEAAAATSARLARFRAALAAATYRDLLEGTLPQP
jgi:cytochrome b pre-mRNA-processing protein 3